MKTSTRIATFVGVIAALLVSGAVPASARAPERSTFSFHHTNHDFFKGQEQQCDFRVVGDWDIDGQETDFFDQVGNLTKMRLDFAYSGTLSNPLTGTSVPNWSVHDSWTLSFAPDGTYLGAAYRTSNFAPYLSVHAHYVYDSQDNVLKDVGFDYAADNKHPYSIAPLCDALS